MTSPALLVIDVQRAFDDPRWGNRNNPAAEENVARLLGAWRNTGSAVIHVRHRSASPNGLFTKEGAEFKPEAVPRADEPVVEKTVNSAFIGTGLEEQLRRQEIDSVAIAGLTTDHCCSTTARMAGNLGFHTWFVSDATATFDREFPEGSIIDAETMHRTALASLNHEFAQIITTGEAVEKLF